MWERISGTLGRHSQTLAPTALVKASPLGLLAAAKSLCEETGKQHHIQIEFLHREMPEEISPDMGLCFFRIVQEALNNIVKHSGAKQAHVEFVGSPSMIRLRIVDAGVGFDPSSMAARGGLGLASMRERLRLLGGTIALHSAPMEGTEIVAEVPLTQTGATALSGESKRRDLEEGANEKTTHFAGRRSCYRGRSTERHARGDYDVVGVAGDGRTLLHAAETLKPDLIVVDIGMPLLNGLDATRQIKRLLPRVKVIVLTMNEDSDSSRRLSGLALGLPSEAFSCAGATAGDREVLKGASYLSPRVTSGAVAALLRGGDVESIRGSRAHSAAARGSPAFGGRPLDEGDCRRSDDQPPNRRCSQVPCYGHS